MADYALRESKQRFSQGGVLSDIRHHLTKHGSYPLVRPQQMHGGAGTESTHLLSLFTSRNQRSQETFPLHRVVRQLKSEPRCPTCPGWAPAPRSTSRLPQLLMNKQISQGVGLTLSTGPEVLVPNSFLVSTLWSHQPMLAERGWGQGRASWLGSACAKGSFSELQTPLPSSSWPLGLTISSSPTRETRHLSKNKALGFVL